MPHNNFSAFRVNIAVTDSASRYLSCVSGKDYFSVIVDSSSQSDPHYPEYDRVQILALLCELYEESKNRKQRLAKLAEIREIVDSFDSSLFSA
jgi:hypothetical protein